MEHLIDWEEVEYISNKRLSGKLSADALSQRVATSFRKGDNDLYLTLKLAQAQTKFKSKFLNSK